MQSTLDMYGYMARHFEEFKNHIGTEWKRAEADAARTIIESQKESALAIQSLHTGSTSAEIAKVMEKRQVFEHAVEVPMSIKKVRRMSDNIQKVFLDGSAAEVWKSCMVCREDFPESLLHNNECGACWCHRFNFYKNNPDEFISKYAYCDNFINTCTNVISIIEKTEAPAEFLRSVSSVFECMVTYNQFKIRKEVELESLPKKGVSLALSICNGLRCPNMKCRQLFAATTEEDSCLHATCTACKTKFCGLCFQTNCDSARCRLNPLPGEISLPESDTYKPVAVRSAMVYQICQALKGMDRKHLLSSARKRSRGADYDDISSQPRPTPMAFVASNKKLMAAMVDAGLDPQSPTGLPANDPLVKTYVYENGLDPFLAELYSGGPSINWDNMGVGARVRLSEDLESTAEAGFGLVVGYVDEMKCLAGQVVVVVKVCNHWRRWRVVLEGSDPSGPSFVVNRASIVEILTPVVIPAGTKFPEAEEDD